MVWLGRRYRVAPQIAGGGGVGFFGVVNSCISRACSSRLLLSPIGLMVSSISPAWPGMWRRCFCIGAVSFMERASSKYASRCASASYEGGSCFKRTCKQGDRILGRSNGGGGRGGSGSRVLRQPQRIREGKISVSKIRSIVGHERKFHLTGDTALYLPYSSGKRECRCIFSSH